MYFDLKNTLISSAFSVFILNKLYKIVKIKSGKNMIIDNKSRADKSTLVSTEELLINAGVIASSVYGVVGLLDSKINYSDDISLDDILKKEEFSSGIKVKKVKDRYEFFISVVLSRNVKISEVLYEISKQVKHNLTKRFNIKIKAVNVVVSAVK